VGFSKFIGYDKEGTITELPTTLNKGVLGTRIVSLNALGFNAPAWVAASIMPFMFISSGKSAPLAILIAFFFPMLILAISEIYLIRKAPSANGVFTFADRYIHRDVATILGWAYIFECVAVVGMTAVLGAQYLEFLIPAIQGEYTAKVLGTVMVLGFLLISLRGVEITSKVAGTFLAFEILVVFGLGLLGILNPQVTDVSFASLYVPDKSVGWAGIAAGGLYAFWMMGNFDSSINMIEEAKTPVRTVQRSLIITLTAVFIIYTVATIGWQLAVPSETLATMFANGDGGAISSVAKVLLPPSLSWIAVFVVITSACAGHQISMMSGARSAYRMSIDGRLPRSLGKVNKRKVPWLITVLIAAAGIVMVWVKPYSQLQWYTDAITAGLILSYSAVLLSFIFAMFKDKKFGVALLASLLPAAGIVFFGYSLYIAGVDPASNYNAWYLTAAVLVIGILIVIYNRITRKKEIPTATEPLSTTESA
jgi:amino acid transporter